MTTHERQDQDLSEELPGEESEPAAAFGSQAESRPASSPAEMDAVRTLPEGVVNPRDQAQFNAHMLQYIHDSHVRLVKLLKDDQRSEMFIQSTEALNRTFKQLHESQAELARRLRTERGRRPWLMALAGLLAAAVLVPVGLFLFRGVSGEIDAEVGQLARARTEQVLANDAALSAQRQAAAELLETVNRGFAANRTLENENRAQHAETARLKDRLVDLEARALDAEARQARAEERAREAQLRNSELALEISDARQRLIEQDLRRDQLGDLLEGKAASPAGELGAEAAPDPAKDPAPDPAEDPAMDSATDPSESPAEAVPEAQPSVVHAALVDPVVEGVNLFLRDAGVLDLRLLRCDGIADGALRNAAFEIRSREGFPVGLHEAESVRLSIDPSSMTAALILKDGATLMRGVRQRFPEEGLSITIAAVAPGSWSLEGVADIVRLEASEPPSPSTVAPDPRPAFDARPLMVRLNGALRSEGLEGFQFFRIDGVEDGDLLNVRVHHYGRSGELRKTVVAARCRIEIEPERRQVRLVFLDGHHVARGREVPFFRGKGDELGKWSIPLQPEDPAIWRGIQSELETPGP